jgi:hypothetical protein
VRALASSTGLRPSRKTSPKSRRQSSGSCALAPVETMGRARPPPAFATCRRSCLSPWLRTPRMTAGSDPRPRPWLPTRRGASRKPVRRPLSRDLFCDTCASRKKRCACAGTAQLAGGYGKGAVKCDALTLFGNVNHITIDIISYILSQIPATCRPRQAAISINTAYPNFHRRISQEPSSCSLSAQHPSGAGRWSYCAMFGFWSAIWLH